MMNVRRTLFATVGALSLLASYGLAYADDAPKPADTPPTDTQTQPTTSQTPSDAQAPAESKDVERVTVTGSRLRKNEFTSSSPIQIITRDESTLEGLTDTADILQKSTTAAGSQQINNTFSAFVVPGGSGVNTISLRGLGANRTLVLVNGRRLAPAGSEGQVGAPDLNTLPQSMIERFEVLKDGGSSIYGSDAVAGAVNVITRKSYDGLELSGDSNVTFEGGGNTYRLDGIWGTVFDKGSITIAGEWYKRDALLASDRSYLSCAQDNVRSVATGQLLDIIDPATGQPICQNTFEGVASRLAGGVFVPDSAAVAGGGPLHLDIPGYHRVGVTYGRAARVFGAPTFCGVDFHVCTATEQFAAMNATQRAQTEAAWRSSQAELNLNDPRFGSTTVITPAERKSGYLQASYDLAPGVEVYTEDLFTRRDSSSQQWLQLFPIIPGGHLTNTIGADAQPVILYSLPQSQQVDFFRGVLGIRGDLGSKIPFFGGWDYDLYFQHSRSDASYTTRFIYDDRVNATTLSLNPCDTSFITISGPVANCPTIQWFSPAVLEGQFTPAQQAFLFGTETGTTTYTQSMVNGSITGDLFQLPAGTVSAALGFELRRDEIDDTPGPMAQANNYWGLSTAGRTTGSDTVHEVFGEVQIPLIANTLIADSVTLDASGRYTNYATFGDGSVYKLGLNWQITPQYRIRGTTGTSFRSPALYEMFLADQTGFQNSNAIDPCVNWDLSSDPRIQASCGPSGLNLPPGWLGAPSGTLIVNGGGGPGVLQAETSQSNTLGFIWTPDWIDFSAAVDYWQIEVDNEVAQLGAANIVLLCHTRSPVLNNGFCNLIDRDSDPASPTFGQIFTVIDQFRNLPSQISQGLDLHTRFAHEFSYGKLILDGDFTWTFKDSIDVIGDGQQDFNGTLYDADFVASLDARFERNDWTFFWHTEMASRTSNDELIGGDQLLFNGTPFLGVYKHYTEFSAVHDASVRYQASDWAITFGIDNVFDEPPPTVSSDGPSIGSFGRQGNAVATGGPYDLLGRRAFINVTKSF